MKINTVEEKIRIQSDPERLGKKLWKNVKSVTKENCKVAELGQNTWLHIKGMTQMWFR